MKNGRVNERNTGNWSLESEPKNFSKKSKKVSRSFDEQEIEILKYCLNQILNNIELDASDKDNQVFRDNGNILIQFDRERVEDIRSIIEKF